MAIRNASYDIVYLLYCHRILIILCIIILVLATACSSNHPLYPTYEELTRRGFYVYILPQDEVKRRGWSQTISIWSWDKHCKGIEVSETFNPITINYRGPSTQPEFTVTIGPWDMAWDSHKPTIEVRLDTPWTQSSTAIYYKSGNYLRLRFQDRFGVPVQISSRLSMNEVVWLISRLQYIGPPPEEVTNPWDHSKCSER